MTDSTRYKNTKNDENNPCAKEQSMSYECLVRNKYDNDKCVLYFENYNECKKFWNKIRIQRISQGISPPYPPLEEREQIKLEYINKLKQS